jgi:hypothetical protein
MSAIEPAADSAAALDALLATLHEPVVRDLAWLLFSPPLICDTRLAEKLANLFETGSDAAAAADWLRALDQAPAALGAAMASAKLTRLGRYAECLLAYFLEHGPALRLVAANVALRRNGRTLGECDFLVETAAGVRLHWELAVKCYLHTPGASTPLAAFVGPNLQDRFDLKVAHLLDHQLPLSARDEFSSLGHAGPWRAQMLVKGWLFYRGFAGDAQVALTAAADVIDPLHARGFWVTLGEWAAHAESAGVQWAVLPRLAWLAPRAPVLAAGGQGHGLCAAAALTERLAQQSGPTMVVGYRAEAIGRVAEAGSQRRYPGGALRECVRGFVVPDDWPDRAYAFAQASMP